MRVGLAMVVLFALGSAAPPVGAEASRLRIGDTLAAFVALRGPPASTAPQYRYEESGWTTSVTMYRGRASRIVYGADLGADTALASSDLLPEASSKAHVRMDDLRPLLALNASGREWSPGVRGLGVGYSRRASGGVNVALALPDVRWRTKDLLLEARFRVFALGGALRSVLEVSPYGFEESASGRTRMNLDDAREAWDCAAALARLVGPFVRSADPKETNGHLKVARAHFKDLHASRAARAATPSLGPPDLPARSEDATASFLAIMGYLEQASQLVLGTLGKDDGPPDQPGVAGCFALGLWLPTLAYVYGSATPEVLAQYLGRLAHAGAESHVPKEHWGPPVDRAKSGAPPEEVLGVLARALADSKKYLDARRAEWKPPEVPKEE
jgi:hypothetical protein